MTPPPSRPYLYKITNEHKQEVFSGDTALCYTAQTDKINDLLKQKYNYMLLCYDKK